jgi:ubiquinone/menaquinone biosynthesis C-methylase UbiE
VKSEKTMISIVTVYNNEKLLNEILIPSLKRQTINYEFLPLDNTNGNFKSAAEALNFGGKQAKGKYILFVHQDIELDSDSWLEKAEKLLGGIPDLGIAGVVGMSENGAQLSDKGRGCISSYGQIWPWSHAVSIPEAVQTLDECLIIISKAVFQELQFDDKNFDGWHLYGADFGLCAKEKGLSTYVLPLFIYHRTLNLNRKDLLKYQKRIYNKHKNNCNKIYTTMGEISRSSIALNSTLQFLKPIYRKIFPDWIELLKKELFDCTTVLDLGCGYDSPIQYCHITHSIGVELFDPFLEESRKKAIHSQYLKADIRSVEFEPKSFDAVLCLEVLEHLTKEEGIELLIKMDRWAKKKVIVKTQNGCISLNRHDDDPLQEHKSRWNSIELKKLGFNAHGMNGWKTLRDHKGSFKTKHQFIAARISDMSQKICYFCPGLAFQLFTVKEISEKRLK